MSMIDFDKISGIAKNAGSVIMDIYNRDVEVELRVIAHRLPRRIKNPIK